MIIKFFIFCLAFLTFEVSHSAEVQFRGLCRQYLEANIENVFSNTHKIRHLSSLRVDEADKPAIEKLGATFERIFIRRALEVVEEYGSLKNYIAKIKLDTKEDIKNLTRFQTLLLY